MMHSPAVVTLIELALEEDLGRGDVTAESIFGADLPGDAEARAVLLAKQPLVVHGFEVARAVFERVDARIRMTAKVADGAAVAQAAGAREVIAELQGPAQSLLAAERTALNFLQRLSGVATQSRRYADAVRGTRARVVDTRKTTPGWRALEKAAVAAGGCHNHRADLGSGVLIKDNHIAACGGIQQAVAAARKQISHLIKIEIEVSDLAGIHEALESGVDVIMLDNMDLAHIREAVSVIKNRATVEVSGGITLNQLSDLAQTGVDLISVGALTHSARAVDLSMRIQ